MSEREQFQAEATRRVGRLLAGKWRLRRLIGMGGMGAVFEASHRNGKSVAVKVLHATLSGSTRQRKRFLREAYVANAIEDPGVVQIHDDGVDSDGSAFLVMELLEGQSLGALCKQQGGTLPAELVVWAAHALLRVLARAHDRGVVHRDIKPDNLFLTHSGGLKVLDFGIARSVQQFPGATVETQSGLVLGTPAFMPPEQARGLWDEVDGRSDVWATAATMFTLLSGSYVHGAGTANELLGRAMSSSAKSLGTLRPDLSPALIQLVDRALSFDSALRFRDARAMQEALCRCPEAGELERDDTLSPPSVLRTLPGGRQETLGYSGAAAVSVSATSGRRKRALIFAALLSASATVLWFLGDNVAPPREAQPGAARSTAPSPLLQTSARASTPLPSTSPEPVPEPVQRAPDVTASLPGSTASAASDVAPHETTAPPKPLPLVSGRSAARRVGVRNAGRGRPAQASSAAPAAPAAAADADELPAVTPRW